MQYLGHMDNGSNITIMTTSGPLDVPSNHVNVHVVRDALNDEDYEAAIELADVSTAVNTFGNGKLTYADGVVRYNGEVLDNSLTKRIVSMMQEGFNADPLVNFLENLMQNPSGRAVRELYRFLECNDLPITPDGYFLAYKNVRDNYMDKYSGKFRNMIGDVCEMPRNQVMDDPNQTCSAGLHFCSIHYLRSMWGFDGHTMIIKINPADVVSIPVDYNNSKGRCCKYEVVAEHEGKGDCEFYTTSVHQFDDYDFYNETSPMFEVGDAVVNEDGIFDIDSVFYDDEEGKWIYLLSNGKWYDEDAL